MLYLGFLRGFLCPHSPFQGGSKLLFRDRHLGRSRCNISLRLYAAWSVHAHCILIWSLTKDTWKDGTPNWVLIHSKNISFRKQKRGICDHFWFKYDLDSHTMHPKFNPTEIRIHDLQIMNSTISYPWNAVVQTTRPSLTSKQSMTWHFDYHPSVIEWKVISTGGYDLEIGHI